VQTTWKPFSNKTKPLTFLLAFTFLISMLVSCAESPPPVDGWRYPNKSDMKDSWANNIKTVPIPYHFSADLNGDGLSDDAWILISTKSDIEYGVFVFFNQKEGGPKVIQIPGFSGLGLTDHAITMEPAGIYSDMGGGPKTKFNHSGIMFFKWESAAKSIFWDNKSHSFKVFHTSD
jgi:hypothetical protein